MQANSSRNQTGMTLEQLNFLQWLGSLTGIAGALMMACNSKASPWAYPVWLCASVSMLVFALYDQLSGLALQQAVFTFINTLGLWRWMIRPPVVGSVLDPKG